MRVIKTAGELEVRDGVPLLFHSPMDEIFRRLLPLFKAHYKVQDYVKMQDAVSKLSSRNIRPMPSSTPRSSAAVALEIDGIDDIAALKALAAGKHTGADPVNNAPTPEEHARAALLQNHGFVLGTLANIYDMNDLEYCWGDDKVGDRVPHEYKPQVPLANPHGASARTMKRRRTTDIAVVPLAFSSLPKRLTQSQMPKVG
ncbi:hypothetical protein GY45DRAFT_775207 [Cubamyces sp. BRFM 1775]|nr:hypothetical protein GY45DRAFT_775207 [Cubamyces sp. BRFM 1775]